MTSRATTTPARTHQKRMPPGSVACSPLVVGAALVGSSAPAVAADFSARKSWAEIRLKS